MTNHPMEPSPELARTLLNTPEEERIAAAYRAGADAELEACREWLEDHVSNLIVDMLRAARHYRRALERLQELENND